MKKEAQKNTQESALIHTGKDKLSRALIVAAIILYSFSLVLLANLAWAGGSTHFGALVKVNNQLDGEGFANLKADVNAVAGNILAIQIPKTSIGQIDKVKGICHSEIDHQNENEFSVSSSELMAKYANADAVIGVLDNRGQLSSQSLNSLKKIERSSNVGFISYVSENPSSKVIMHNIASGESNLVRALLYMDEYAKTVGKPLVIEMHINAAELENVLFTQICQTFANAGVQFLGTAIPSESFSTSAPVQLAFSTINVNTGQMTDQTDFWAIEELKEQQLMLLGSDQQTCSVFFQIESEFDKAYLSNRSEDILLVTAITADGTVHYYHVQNKETALIPRKLMNGTLVLEDGLSGIFPHRSKGAIFNTAVAQNQFVALGKTKQQVQLETGDNFNISVASPGARKLAMSVDDINTEMVIEVFNEDGETVYKRTSDIDTRSIKTSINLPQGGRGLYFLDLRSKDFHQCVALMMD